MSTNFFNIHRNFEFHDRITIDQIEQALTSINMKKSEKLDNLLQVHKWSFEQGIEKPGYIRAWIRVNTKGGYKLRIESFGSAEEVGGIAKFIDDVGARVQDSANTIFAYTNTRQESRNNVH